MSSVPWTFQLFGSWVRQIVDKYHRMHTHVHLSHTWACAVGRLKECFVYFSLNVRELWPQPALRAAWAWVLTWFCLCLFVSAAFSTSRSYEEYEFYSSLDMSLTPPCANGTVECHCGIVWPLTRVQLPLELLSLFGGRLKELIKMQISVFN